ncbi:hypothetical protein GL263_25510 [Streptomyces durbertensis]|uniref:Uncharacterized protein n=1 Tax=Streptomyces durbertensis TaxID=2448886 RepID=A0ABR6ENF9_9ACTN|nr:hypothetical protein [Streptomyces durbertensis]
MAALFAVPPAPDGSVRTLEVREFDEAYVVRPSGPAPAASGARPTPAEPGGSTFVVAKAGGEVTTLPNYPCEQAIASYRRSRAAGVW